MSTDSAARSLPVASVAARALLAGLVVAAVSSGRRGPNLALGAVLAISVLAFDRRHLLTLKNFFLAYALVVFLVGSAVLHLAPTSVLADLAWYLTAFLLGYAVGSLRVKDAAPDEPARDAAGGGGGTRRRRLSPVAVEGALVVLVALNLAYLAVQLFQYGIVGFYRGQALLEQFLTYGQASTGAGAQQIVRFLLKFSAIGLIVLYAQACFEAGNRVRYRYPLVLLLGFPILSLRRYDAVIGAVTLLALYGCERRVSASHRRAGEGVDRAGAGRTTRTSPIRLLALGGATTCAVLAAVAIGVLRQGFLPDASPARSGSLPVLTSEITPVTAYAEIRANIGILGHPNGRTILPPLLLKVVPRAWFPGKPQNSVAYYMSVVRPGEFAAGYAIPPTFFGEAYLSFGFGGALAACFLLGALTSRLDQAYKAPVLARLPAFLLVWANFLSISRDPLSESLAGVLLTLAVWLVGRHLFTLKRERPTTSRPLIPAGLLPDRISAVSTPEPTS